MEQLIWEPGSSKITLKMNLSKKMTGHALRQSTLTLLQKVTLMFTTQVRILHLDRDSVLKATAIVQMEMDNAMLLSSMRNLPHSQTTWLLVLTTPPIRLCTRVLHLDSTCGIYHVQQQLHKNGATTCKVLRRRLFLISTSTC